MSEKWQNGIIWTISILVPALVALLFFTPGRDWGTDVSILPRLNACINATVSFLLVAGILFIRKGHRQWHRACMIGAFGLSALFLVSYVIYHSSAETTHFEGEGLIKILYFSILFSHILLAAIILPFILITLSRALSRRFDKHKKIARITFPLWLYVSVTGVVVYLMIAPYYN